MNNNDVNSLIDSLELDRNIDLEDVPEIDLYMDQVIQMFESKYSDCRRNEDEKVLTKTMINNYAKGKLLMPIKNKKYSKEHILLMNLIYNLKGSLSISDIKSSLDIILKDEDYPLREIYSGFTEVSKKDVEHFKKDISNKVSDIKDTITRNESLSGENEEKLMLLFSIINMSNMYRKLGEKIVDEYFAKGEDK